MTAMFTNITLSPNYYNNMLTTWSALPLKLGVVFDAGYSKYYDGLPAAARQSMIDVYSWNITDGGMITAPVVSTDAITLISETEANIDYSIVSDGGETVTARGICWSTSPIPTVLDNFNNEGSGTGIYTSNITGIVLNTTYYVRAFATNVIGTTYGNEKTVRVDIVPTLTPKKIDPQYDKEVVLSAVFSKAIDPMNFTVTDFNVANCEVIEIAETTAGTNFDIKVKALTEGYCSVQIAQTAYFTASNTITFDYQTVPPTAEIILGLPSPTNSVTMPVAVVFDEEVFDFDINDVSVTNGVITTWSPTADGINYVFDIEAIGNGTVSIEIPNGAAYSLYNYFNSDISTSYVFDNTAPTATLIALNSLPANVSPVRYKMVFSEVVIGFDVSSIVLSSGSGTIANFAGSGSTYYLDIEHPTEGNNSFIVETATISDQAGNTMTSDYSDSFLFDSYPPVPVISYSFSSPTFSNPMPMTIDFGEPVIGFDTNTLTTQFTVLGANISAIGSVANNQVFSFELVPESLYENIQLFFNANQLSDNASNMNEISNVVDILYDNVSVVAELSFATLASGSTNSVPVEINLEFNKTNIVGFNLATDVSVTNGTISANSIVSPSLIVIYVQPTNQGAVSVEIPVNVFSDDAGNANIASGVLEFVYDNISPVPNITIANASITNTNINASVNFGEAVTDFSRSDLEITNGFIMNDIVYIADGLYTFEVMPQTNGQVSITLYPQSATDLAGNTFTSAETETVYFDNTVPKPLISSTVGSLTNIQQIPITIDFGEYVNNFNSNLLAFTNASMVSFNNTNPVLGLYHADIRPLTNGLVSVEIPANLCSDNAGNYNLSAMYSVLFDASAPTLTISSVAGTYTKNNQIAVNFNFSEVVSNFTQSDIFIVNGSILNFAGSGSSYNLVVNITQQGSTEISVAPNTFSDIAGTVNISSAYYSIVYDGVSPEPTIVSPVVAYTNFSSINMTLNFGETVSTFTVAKMMLTNANALLSGGTNGVYNLQIFPINEGKVSCYVPANQCTDLAGNANLKSNEIVFTYDKTIPKPTISATQTIYQTSFIQITIDFGEEVLNFDLSDVVIGAHNAKLVAGVNGIYYLNITPLSEGLIVVSIPANLCTDLTGNLNAASNEFPLIYDATLPLPVITSSASSYTAISPVAITVNFGEHVNLFASTDLQLSNAVITGFAGASGIFTFHLLPIANGVCSFNIPAAVCTDNADNQNIAASYQIYYDTQAPTVQISSASLSPTKESTALINFNFNETVQGFAQDDIVITNCTIVDFYGSDKRYLALISTPISGVATVKVNAAKFSDLTGNQNLLSASYSIIFDHIAPVPVISTSSTSPTLVEPIPFTVNFGETITDFVTSDINIEGATLYTVLSNNDKVVIFNVMPNSVTEMVKVSLPAHRVFDLAGNPNQLSNTVVVEYDADGIIPVISFVEAGQTSPTNKSSFGIEIRFNKPITWIGAQAININNATYDGFMHITNSPVSIYTVNIHPLQHGEITISVPEGVALGATGAISYASSEFSVNYDIVQPEASIVRWTKTPSNENPVQFYVNFSEAITDFTADDLVFSGVGVGTTMSKLSESQYLINVFPTDNGEFSFYLPAEVATDLAGNKNLLSHSITTIYDNVKPEPELTLTSLTTHPGEIVFHLVFAEEVSGFETTDVFTNNKAKNVVIQTISNSEYNIVLTDLTNGNMNVEILANSCSDAAGNTNPSVSQTVYYNDQSPTVTLINILGVGITNQNEIPIDIKFSETVVDFVSEDITISNCTINSFTAFDAQNSIFRIVVSAIEEGTLLVRVPYDAARSTTNNPNMESNLISIIYTMQGPKPVITSTVVSPNNVATWELKVDFGTTISNFDSNNVSVTNAIAAWKGGTNGNYQLTLSPTSSGKVSVYVPIGKFNDLAGNSNTEPASFEAIFDNIAPTHWFTDTETDYSGKQLINVFLNLSEKSNAISQIMLQRTNCRIISFQQLNDNLYSLEVAPEIDGKAVITLAGGKYSDIAGNVNQKGAEWSITFDRVHPEPSITTQATSLVNYSPIVVTVDFGEKLQSFNTVGIVSGSPASSKQIADGKYEFTLTPTTDTQIEFKILPNAAADFALNGNETTAGIMIEYHKSAPILTFVGKAFTNVAPAMVEIRFDENVYGFESSDIKVTNATAEFMAHNNGFYTLTLTPLAGLTKTNISIDIQANAASDRAANPTAKSVFSFVYDIGQPQPIIYRTTPLYTNVYPVPVVVDFGEVVTIGNLSELFGGIPVASYTNVEGVYTFYMSPTEGSNTYFIAENRVKDESENVNLPSNVIEIITDRFAPSVQVTSLETFAYTVENEIGMQIKFSENVINFSSTSIALNGGTGRDFADMGNGVYTFNFVPEVDFTQPQNTSFSKIYHISVPAGAAHDLAGLKNAEASFNLPYQTFQSPCLSQTPELNWFTPLVRVDCNIVINSNEHLIINKGVRVEFTGNYTITVKGKLSIKGEKGSEVIFTSQGANRWGGLIMEANSELSSLLSYFVLENVSNSTAALSLANQSVVTIENAILQNNTIANGALAVSASANVLLKHSVIRNNTAQNKGGAIYTSGNSKLDVRNCLIVNNQAAEGGGLYIDNPTMKILNTTIAQNAAAVGSELLINQTLNIQFLNNIVWNALGTNEIVNRSSLSNYISFSLIPLSTTSTANFYINHNIEGNPQFVNISAQTGASAVNNISDWKLKETSPCVNAGNSVSDDYELVSDLFGNPRVFNNTRIDMGAHETAMNFSYTDFAALSAMYNLISANASLLNGWHNDPNLWITKNPATEMWIGVNTSGGRVVSINLSGFVLSAQLPNEIGELRFLKDFDIQSNNFSGTVPATISKLIDLETLRLNKNEFTGSVISELSSLIHLTVLDLGSNNFTGTVPNLLASLSKLQIWDMSDNNIENLPNFVSANKLFFMAIRNNKLNFDDLENNRNVAQNFAYTPQQPVNVPVNIGALIEQVVTMNIVVGGSKNSYQWYKDGKAIEGATLAIYSFTMNNNSDGTYTCRVNNSLVPDLTLERAPVQVYLRADLPLPKVIVPERYCVGSNPVTLAVNNMPYTNAIVKWNIDNTPMEGESVRFYMNNSLYGDVHYELALNTSDIFTFHIEMRPELVYNGTTLQILNSLEGDVITWYSSALPESANVSKLAETSASLNLSGQSAEYFRVRITTKDNCSAISNFYRRNGDEITGIANNELNIQKMNVFPNPADGHFEVVLPNQRNENFEIEIFDVNGKLLEHRSIVTDSDLRELFTIEVKGVYFVRLKTSESIQFEKVVIF